MVCWGLLGGPPVFWNVPYCPSIIASCHAFIPRLATPTETPQASCGMVIRAALYLVIIGQCPVKVKDRASAGRKGRLPAAESLSRNLSQCHRLLSTQGLARCRRKSRYHSKKKRTCIGPFFLTSFSRKSITSETGPIGKGWGGFLFGLNKNPPPPR